MGQAERHFVFILDDLSGVWGITDTHYLHTKLVTRGNRPEGFEAQIASNWATKVKWSDVVFHLGDVALGDQKKAHNQYVVPMPGWKILVRGNHDGQKHQWYLDHGWNDVCDSATLLLRDGRRVVLSHKPLYDDGSYDVLIHGHFHDDDHRRLEPDMLALASPKHKLMALEYHGYTPLLLADFV